jgi:hypothetical protein
MNVGMWNLTLFQATFEATRFFRRAEAFALSTQHQRAMNAGDNPVLFQDYAAAIRAAISKNA